MKTYKKIGLGLLFALFGLIIFSALPSHKASAALGFNTNPFAGSQFAMKNGKITTTITTDAQTGSTQTLTFSNTSAKPLVYSSDASFFCSQTQPNPSIPATITLPKAPSGASLTGNLVAWYFNSVGGGCSNKANGSITIQNQDSGTGGLPDTLTYNGNTYHLIDASYPLYGLNNVKGSDCYGGSVILSNAAGTSGTAWVGLEGNGGAVALNKYIIAAGASSGVVNLIQGCGFQDPSANTAGYSGNIVNGQLNAAAPTTPTTPPGAAGTSCESNDSAGAFSWILCPAFDMMDSVTGFFLGFVEGQLCIATGPISSTDGVVCGGNNLTDGVHQAWTVFKNISSALLVIILLVVVISQAIGGGPLDAYTVRKMLPKIVLAVIFMQLSWVLVKWLVDLSNDLGAGIRDLMAAPFGGTSNLTLPNILGTQFGKIGNVGSGFVFFSTIAAGAVASIIVSIPTLALLGLYVILALLTAFLVLVFRKILIILLVILAPVALVLWILPGTEKYWKLWQDNFIKLLLMFPMIMGLITAGQILAYITSGTPNGLIFNPHLALAHLESIPVPVIALVGDFAGVIIIIAAYFAPFFLLPQTYKWGGAAMGAAGKGFANLTEQAGGKQAKEYLNWRQGLSPWKQARAARKANIEREAKMGFYNDLNQRGDTDSLRGVGRGALGRFRRARLAGVETPGHYRGVRDTIVRAGAQQAEAESLKEAKDVLAYEVSQALPPGVNHDKYVQDIIMANPGAVVHGRVRNEADWRAAAEQAAQYGGSNNAFLEQLHHQAHETDAAGHLTNPGLATRWEKFINSSEGTQLMLAKFPMFYKDPDYSQVDPTTRVVTGDIHTTVEQMTPEAFTSTGMDGETIRTIIGQLSQVIATGGPGAGRAEELLQSVYVTFNQAMTGESTNRRINPAAAEAVRAAVTNDVTVLGRLNTGRGVGGVPGINGAAVQATIGNAAAAGTPTAAYLTTAVKNITDEVTPDGRVLR